MNNVQKNKLKYQVWSTFINLFFIVIIFITLIGSIQQIKQIENDKDVWFSINYDYKSCHCSTENEKFIDYCNDFVLDCRELLFPNYINQEVKTK